MFVTVRLHPLDGRGRQADLDLQKADIVSVEYGPETAFVVLRNGVTLIVYEAGLREQLHAA